MWSDRFENAKLLAKARLIGAEIGEKARRALIEKGQAFWVCDSGAGTGEGGRGVWVKSGAAWVCANGEAPQLALSVDLVEKFMAAWAAESKKVLGRGGGFDFDGFGTLRLTYFAGGVRNVPNWSGGHRAVTCRASFRIKFGAAEIHPVAGSSA